MAKMLMMITMLFGGGMNPTFLLVKELGLINNRWAVILTNLLSTYNCILMSSYIRTLPASLFESARLDGAGESKILFSIVLPLSKTILAVMAINTFVANWNTFFWPFLVTTKESMFTIQVALKTFKASSWTLLSPMMAGATISALPMFILFFALQRYFLEGVTVGAVKG